MHISLKTCLADHKIALCIATYIQVYRLVQTWGFQIGVKALHI